jgi:3-hydroxypropanoate dehydrogenase
MLPFDLVVECSMTSTSTTPYVLDDAALDTLFREARTANTFTDEPVTVDDIRAIHDLFRFGPTAMNNQPLRLVVVQSPEARERLVQHMGGSNKAKTASAPAVVIVAADEAFQERLEEHFPHAPGVRKMFDDDAELRVDNARLNTALQTGYLILAIRAAGLAAGPMAGFDRAGVDAEFLAGTSWRSEYVINIGHPGPDAWADRLPRISFDDAATVV